MAGAYAAVTSLLSVLDQVHLYHARRPIFLDEQQRQLSELRGKVTFSQSYLESYHKGGDQGAENLESKIADISYEAEDIIESHIVDDIQARLPENKKLLGSTNQFSRSLQKVFEEIESIEKVVTEIIGKSTLEDQQCRFLSTDRLSRVATPLCSNDTIVGFHDEMQHIVNKLTSHQLGRQTIPITGMGGMGKTTLAKSVYDKPVIARRFDVRGWVTVSQEYDAREMLYSLLDDMKALGGGDKQDNLEDLGLKLHKYLSQRRYLIVLDDMWSIKPWEKLQLYLPDNANGSRVLVTSRLLEVAKCFDSSNHFKMNFLDENTSWSLLCKTVFGQGSCPSEFEEIGKRIAKNCKGLALTIVVTGGLLTKSEMILQSWKDISEGISKVENSEDDDHCLKILSLSYNHLPMYLKPCFIYMGVFPEDHKIHVSKVIKLWVAEGFLKPISGRSLEEIAEDYLHDLIDRNLVMVHELGYTGNIKVCKLHDSLRDFCLREGWKCRLFCPIKNQSHYIPQQRRVADYGSDRKEEHFPQMLNILQSTSYLRSYLCFAKGNCLPFEQQHNHYNYLKLLRVMDHDDIDMNAEYGPLHMFQLVNARYLRTWIIKEVESSDKLLHHLDVFWNIQSLYLMGLVDMVKLVFLQFWEMPQLRHVHIQDFSLPDPPSQIDGQDTPVLEHLQTLACVMNPRFTQDFLKMIPNIKTLKIGVYPDPYDDIEHEVVAKSSIHTLRNLCHLRVLQSLSICIYYELFHHIEYSDFLQIKFPVSLKKLTLTNGQFKWDDIGTLVGELPKLEHLILNWCCAGRRWNPGEGQFDTLRALKLAYSAPLEWNVDSVHFPCLEHLVLSHVSDYMAEIPPGIGEIETLQSIHVDYGSDSLISSAKKIFEEQRDLGNSDFRLIIT